ncbi:MAG: flexitail domain-containing putative surface protein, partial [Dehalococcoidia bacterium]
RIVAYTLDPATKNVTGTQVIGSSLDDVMGIAFDPTAPASPVKVYASRRDRSATDGFESKVSVFTGPAWTRTDIITGLPTGRPLLNHLTNGLAFDSTGKLYIAQGSQTDSGIVEGGNWPETPLSAAILVADVSAPGFNGAITYSPAGVPADDNVNKTGGDVSVFAPGTRNPFDLLVHSNGKIYATDNGPSGPNPSATCMTSVGGVSTSDELNLIEAGNYYGHPNRNRGRTDARQCTYHPGEEGNGLDFTGPIDLLPAHCSCDGITEYIGTAFGGSMQGDLLIAGLQTSQVYRVELSGDGSSVVSDTSLAGSFNAPLDVTTGADGTIYVAEFGGDKITYLAPDTDHDGCADSRELGTQGSLGGARNPDFFWDFFDTPDATNVRDRIISAGDILRLVFRFGSTGNAAIDPLSMPPGSGYHPAFDRSAPTPGGDPWDLNAADGSISAGDILFVVKQFGHTCA